MQLSVNKMRTKFLVKYMFTIQPYTVLYPRQGKKKKKKQHKSCKKFQVKEEEEDGKQRSNKPSYMNCGS